MDWIYKPWSWYVAGPLIALIMFILLLLGKQFGMSSSLRTMCSIGGAGKAADNFRFDWKKERWNLTVLVGAIMEELCKEKSDTASVSHSLSPLIYSDGVISNCF